jgi:hypothetical protein
MSLLSQRPAATLTADQLSIVLTIDKDALLAYGGEKGRALVNDMVGAGHGDWGGAEYPERRLTDNDVIALLPVLLDLAIS